MIILPTTFKKYFWDVDWDDLNQHVQQYHRFIISRLLDKGDLGEVKWVRSHFKNNEIFEAMKSSKIISKKTRHFWLANEKLLSASSSE